MWGTGDVPPEGSACKRARTPSAWRLLCPLIGVQVADACRVTLLAKAKMAASPAGKAKVAAASEEPRTGWTSLRSGRAERG